MISDLTARQRDVARLVRAGWTDQRIAGELGISDRRVRQLVARIAERWQLDPQRSYRVQIAQYEAA